MQDFTLPNTEYAPPKAGEPPLHRAAREGDHAAISALADAGTDLDAAFDIGLDPDAGPRLATPLMVAAGSGDGATKATVKLLLELGAGSNIIIEGSSAATFAFEGLGWNYKPGGDAARARLVLDAGSPLPRQPERANNLLCSTAEMGDEERLCILLERGFDANGHWDPAAAHQRGRRAVECFTKCRDSQPDMFATMPGVVRSSITESKKEIEEQMFEQLCSAPSGYEIPLFCAAESGNAQCVRMLLEAGADPYAKDNSQQTAMYYASTVQAVNALIKAGLSLEDTDEYGYSPLCNAVLEGESELPRIQSLIEAGANINATHDRGYTVFMSAVGSARYPALLRLLIESGADPHAVTELGYNAFHAAIDVNFSANAEESVRDTLGYLKELGVNIEHRNQNNRTPLAHAIAEGTGLEVRVLCDLGADPNALCTKHECSGDSCSSIDLPLLFHAANGTGVDKHIKTKALLMAGADPLAKDADGCTPLMHVVASLCSDAEYEDEGALYDAFFKELSRLRLEGMPMPTSCESFVAESTPFLQTFVEHFASGIPVDKTYEFSETWRTENIDCIVSLGAYEGWARHQHNDRTSN